MLMTIETDCMLCVEVSLFLTRLPPITLSLFFSHLIVLHSVAEERPTSLAKTLFTAIFFPYLLISLCFRTKDMLRHGIGLPLRFVSLILV